MPKGVDSFDLDSFLEEECAKYKYVIQAKQFVTIDRNLDVLNEWLRKNSSIINVKDIKFQADTDWDAYLVIFEIKESDLEKLEG
jgi:hypothetical protein